jgi:hypothetical protein
MPLGVPVNNEPSSFCATLRERAGGDGKVSEHGVGEREHAE